MEVREVTSPLEMTREAGGVAVVRMRRPDTHNALMPAMSRALAAAIGSLAADSEVRVIVIGGEDDVFATGFELASMRSTEAAEEAMVASGELWEAIERCPKPLIAGVSGFALGGGFELALACDLVIAAKSSKFGLPEITLGLIPGGGATQRLTRLIGKHRAMELILTGRRFDTKQARNLGIVNHIASDREWLVETVTLAQVISQRAPIAVELAVEAVRAADRRLLDDGIELERELQLRALHTEDRIEAGQAAITHRRPGFSGR